MMDISDLRPMARARLNDVPEAVLAGQMPVALYGMGFLGRWAVRELKANGIAVSACFDGNPALAGSEVDGVPVHAPDRLEYLAPSFVLITARHAVIPVSARLAALSIPHASLDAFFVARDMTAFEAVHDLLDDDRSRQVLVAVMQAMLTGDRQPLLSVFEKDQYFCLPQFCGLEKEVYVDAGAYVGDSVERFIWTHYGVFDRIIAFEPGPRQFAALKTRTERLATEWALDAHQIVLEHAALSDISGQAVAASRNGQMTNLAIGGEGVGVTLAALDTYLAGNRITFLKADVEGMEMPLLKGAEQTITTHRPKLAICVYHYPSDIPVITQYLKSLVPEYRFALRHHSPQLLETVLYAWVD